MDLTKILAELRQERTEVEAAILSLECFAQSRGRRRASALWKESLFRIGRLTLLTQGW